VMTDAQLRYGGQPSQESTGVRCCRRPSTQTTLFTEAHVGLQLVGLQHGPHNPSTRQIALPWGTIRAARGLARRRCLHALRCRRLGTRPLHGDYRQWPGQPVRCRKFPFSVPSAASCYDEHLPGNTTARQHLLRWAILVSKQPQCTVVRCCPGEGEDPTSNLSPRRRRQARL